MLSFHTPFTKTLFKSTHVRVNSFRICTSESFIEFEEILSTGTARQEGKEKGRKGTSYDPRPVPFSLFLEPSLTCEIKVSLFLLGEFRILLHFPFKNLLPLITKQKRMLKMKKWEFPDPSFFFCFLGKF